MREVPLKMLCWCPGSPDLKLLGLEREQWEHVFPNRTPRYEVGIPKGKSFGCIGLFSAMIPNLLPYCHKCLGGKPLTHKNNEFGEVERGFVSF